MKKFLLILLILIAVAVPTLAQNKVPPEIRAEAIRKNFRPCRNCRP